jgi:hypothetical protein
VASWAEFESAEPQLAGRVRDAFAGHRHHTAATLRRDGSPRLSGTEVEWAEGQLRMGVMAGAVRLTDLHRDPRIALHSQGVDPPEGDPAGWPGEAKVQGRAIDVEATHDAHLFQIEIDAVTFTRLGDPPDHLVIEWWRPGRGVTTFERR